jgi:hypothetical protein
MQQEQEQERINKDLIPQAIKALKELKPKELPDVSAKEAIRQMRRYIDGALKKNYTYDEISELLAGLDIHISGSRLKYLLGEVKKSTRTRKKKKVDQVEEIAVNQGEGTAVEQGASEPQELAPNGAQKKGKRKSQSGQSEKVQSQTQSQPKSDSQLQSETPTFKPKLYNDADL